MARLAVAVNPTIETNRDWKPFLDAVRNHEHLWHFINRYPARSRTAVALALSLAKWWLRIYENNIEHLSCGCCAFLDCIDCPLWFENACDSGSAQEVYSRILAAYTEHFNALPKRDKQRLAA